MPAFYFFIHGMFQSKQSWKTVIRLLEDKGYTSVAIDLPGHGISTESVSGKGIDDYANSVIQEIEQMHQPVILVMHDMSGWVGTEVARRRPDLICQLVYLAAMYGNRADYEHPEFYTEPGRIERALHAQNGILSIDPKEARYIFFGDLDDLQFEIASSALGYESERLLGEQPVIPGIEFHDIPSTYIQLVNDKALPLNVQKMMQKALRPTSVFTLDTDHAPFYSAPQQLTDILIELNHH